MERTTILCILIIFLPIIKGSIPGTFFWKPRLGLDLTLPFKGSHKSKELTKDNILKGVVVVVRGYELGISVLVLSKSIPNTKQFPHLNPLTPFFYTNAYRWLLRHLELIKPWLGGSDGSYCDTHNVWKKRFQHMNSVIPTWMRYMFPYIPQMYWKLQEIQEERYYKYAESAFGKHYKYPSKQFQDYKSEIVESDSGWDSQFSLKVG